MEVLSKLVSLESGYDQEGEVMYGTRREGVTVEFMELKNPIIILARISRTIGSIYIAGKHPSMPLYECQTTS